MPRKYFPTTSSKAEFLLDDKCWRSHRVAPWKHQFCRFSSFAFVALILILVAFILDRLLLQPEPCSTNIIQAFRCLFFSVGRALFIFSFTPKHFSLEFINDKKIRMFIFVCYQEKIITRHKDFLWHRLSSRKQPQKARDLKLRLEETITQGLLPFPLTWSLPLTSEIWRLSSITRWNEFHSSPLARFMSQKLFREQ